ncbi:unnamed protein product, partial [Prorocentrum cordatum]
KLRHEKWMDSLQAPQWADEERRKKARGAELLVGDLAASGLPGQYAVNLLLQLLPTKLFLSSSQHATWLLSILHALLVPVPERAPAAAAEAASPPAAPAAE